MIERGELTTATRKSRRPKSWWTLDAQEVEHIARAREPFHVAPN